MEVRNVPSLYAQLDLSNKAVRRGCLHVWGWRTLIDRYTVDRDRDRDRERERARERVRCDLWLLREQIRGCGNEVNNRSKSGVDYCTLVTYFSLGLESKLHQLFPLWNVAVHNMHLVPPMQTWQPGSSSLIELDYGLRSTAYSKSSVP